ncbi:MAG: hypothetical protein ACR2JK_17345 [Geodermatophilaceae bacterium]
MRRRLVLIVAVAFAAACSTSPGDPGEAGSARVQVVTPLPPEAMAGVGYRLYAARDDITVNGRSAVDTFGVSSIIALPDGTIFALQDARVSVADSDDHSLGRDRGLALVRITPDGVASLVEGPYADRERGLDVGPLCASADGTLFALATETYRLVARDPDGSWRDVTAGPDAVDGLVSAGDGGPARQATLGLVRACAATADGSIYLAEDCLVRRIGPDGTIDTVAGRRDRGSDRGAGCGQVDSENRHDPPTVPVPSYEGPAREAELGELSALAAAPDGSVWISALRGLQQLTPDGRIRSVPVPDELVGPYAITGLDTLPDGTLLTAYGVYGPTGIASRDPVTGAWTILVPPDSNFVGVAAPAPLGDLTLYRARIASSADRVYLAVAAGDNAGIIMVPWD